MKLTQRAGFSIPMSDETWIKADLEITLDDKEIKMPKKYRVNETIDKGIKLINERLAFHIGKQIQDVKKMKKGI